MFKSNPIPISRKRVEKNITNEPSVKKKCVPTKNNNSFEKQSSKTGDAHWSSDYMDDDSLFSEINVADHPSTPLEVFPPQNTDFPIQCTQQFLNDLNSSFVPPCDTNVLDYTNFFCETQYTTSEEIQSNSLLRNQTTTVKEEELGQLSDSFWQTQLFPEEIDESFRNGQFFGLPQSVQQLIYEHKDIKNLYG